MTLRISRINERQVTESTPDERGDTPATVRPAYLLLAVRSHWKPEGWWAKRTRGQRAFRIFCTPTQPGPNWSTHSPMTERMLWVTARSELALFNWNSRE